MAMLREPSDGLTTDAASAASPVITPDKAPCSICRERPRLGALTRCKRCLQQAADADRRARAAAEATVNGRAQTSKPTAVKRCSVCKIAKPLDEFGPHHRSKDGKRKACKPCVRAGRALCKPLRPEQAVVQKIAAAKPERRERNRHAVRSWAQRNPHAVRARQVLMRARRRGAVTPPATCEIAECESTNLVAHHSDYSRPLDVLHICHRHHRLLHGGVALALKPGVPAYLKRLPPTDAQLANIPKRRAA